MTNPLLTTINDNNNERDGTSSSCWLHSSCFGSRKVTKEQSDLAGSGRAKASVQRGRTGVDGIKRTRKPMIVHVSID
jgi:hypothetical protein